MTLVEFWEQEQGIYEGSPKGSLNGLRPRAEQALATARAGIEAARASKQKAAGDAAAWQQKIAALRAQMPADGPAEAAADAVELRKLIAELHVAAGRISSFGDEILKLEADVARASAERDRFIAKAAEAAAASAAAKEREKTRTSWLDSSATQLLLLPNLVAVPSIATQKVLATAPERSAAELRIADYFPALSPIHDIIDERWQLRSNELGVLKTAAQQADVALAAQLSKPELGLDGQIEHARLAYERAWSALASYVYTAEEHLNRALCLYGVAASLPAPSTSLAAGMTGTFQAAAVACRPKETARNDALDKLFSAMGSFAKAALAAGPNDPVPSNQDVIDALDDLEKKANLLRPDGPNDIDVWEAALPDEAFRGFAALQEATDILTRLAAVSPRSLLDNLTSAETNLVTALANATSADRVTAFLRDTVAQRRDRLDRANVSRLDQLVSAARGDL